MDVIHAFLQLLSDPREVLSYWIESLGPIVTSVPLFLIVFIETGLVFFPFLPGDSLLFAAGVLSASTSGLHIGLVLAVFLTAAILGNISNYWIARTLGTHILESGKIPAFTPERVAKLDTFFENYGGLTIVITRFMPFLRTFAPFVAGMGHMPFSSFMFYNVLGGSAWVLSFVGIGYFFGSVPFVQDHFEMIVLGIVVVSIAPACIAALKSFLTRRSTRTK